MSAPRFAIYYAPAPDSDLHRFGAAVLGYDAAAGASCAQWVPPGLAPADWADLTQEPRRYGFHATLKAPFRLAAGTSEDDLLRAVRDVAGSVAPVSLALQVTALEGFVALTPVQAPPALAALEARVVQGLEPLRAPLSPAEVARRLAVPLSPRQQEHLARFGYPYVLEDFRFHMTLTGRLPVPIQPAVREALATKFTQSVASPVVEMDHLSVFAQPDANAPFRIIDSVAVGGA